MIIFITSLCGDTFLEHGVGGGSVLKGQNMKLRLQCSNCGPTEFEMPYVFGSKQVGQLKYVGQRPQIWPKFYKVACKIFAWERCYHPDHFYYCNHLITIANIFQWRAISQEFKCFMLPGQAYLKLNVNYAIKGSSAMKRQIFQLLINVENYLA